MIIQLDEFLPIMSHDPLITWSCEIRGSLTGGGSARKPLSRHRLLVVKLSIFFFCSLISHYYNNVKKLLQESSRVHLHFNGIVTPLLADTIRTSKWRSLYRGVGYVKVLPKLAYFFTKTCSRV